MFVCLSALLVWMSAMLYIYVFQSLWLAACISHAQQHAVDWQ